MSGDHRDPPPDTPPCLECGSSASVEPIAPMQVRGRTVRWYAACHALLMDGTASENARHQAARIAAAAERGELDRSKDAGKTAGVIHPRNPGADQ